jgi:hypothetical protein
MAVSADVDGTVFQVSSQSTYPTDINDADVTVGYYGPQGLTDLVSSAFVRVRGPNDPPDGVFTALPPRTATTSDRSRCSGWVLTDARDINASGQIVGIGSFGGAAHGFVLTPTTPPCPAIAIAPATLPAGRRADGRAALAAAWASSMRS